MVVGAGAGGVGLAEDGAGDGEARSSRIPLREARSSVARALGLMLTVGELTTLATVSVGGPMVIAAADATTTTPATAMADSSGTNRDDETIRRTYGATELFGSGRDIDESACLPDKIQTLRRRQGRK